MIKINSICLFYNYNFKKRVDNIKKFLPNIIIFTNQKNELNIDFFEASDKYQLIEKGIDKYSNTFFLDDDYYLDKEFFYLDLNKDLGLLKDANNKIINTCVFCKNKDCISYLKSDNLKNINFIFDFFVISQKIIKENLSKVSLFFNFISDNLRINEYHKCLLKNLDNPEIDNIYCFTKEKIPKIKNNENYDKLKLIDINPLNVDYNYILDFIKNNNIKGYKIITFPDIYFDKLNLKNIFLKMEKEMNRKSHEKSPIIFSLSAYNVDENLNLSQNIHINTLDSSYNHKALIFNEINFDKTNISLNLKYSINCLLNDLIKENYIFNICKEIKIFHLDNIVINKNKTNNGNKKIYLIPTYDINKLSINNLNKELFNDDEYKFYLNTCLSLSDIIKIKN